MAWLRVAVEAQNNFHETAGFDKRLFILFIQYLQNKKNKIWRIYRGHLDTAKPKAKLPVSICVC